MKCDTCGTELVIADGKKSGFCHVCGSTFRVDASGSQVYDKSAIKEFAKAVVDEQEARKKAAPADPPDPPPDPPDPPENPDKKWEK